MITVEPLGGLANRMRFIASAVWLKEKLSTRLFVVWNENHELNCPYHLLFESNEAFTIKPQKFKHFIQSSNQYAGTQKLRVNLINYWLGINYCLTDPDIENLFLSGKQDICETLSRYKGIYIKSCHEFGDNGEAVKLFKPILPLRKKIDAITGSYTPNTIGIHIRRTDNEKSIAYSPISLFIARMNEEIALNSETTFFLCTDDKKVEDDLKNRFGDKVNVYEKEINRQSVKGVQDALVDFYCLANTKKILGSYWSSFSELAAKINNVPLQTVKIT